MSSLHKLVSMFHSESNTGRKKAMLRQKIFSSEMNLYSDIEVITKPYCWSTSNNYRLNRGIYVF